MTIDSRRPRARFEDPLNYLSRALTKIYTAWLITAYPFACRGRNLSVHYPCRVSRKTANAISLGNSIQIGKDVWLNIEASESQEPKIIIDDHTTVSARTVISSRNCIHIGRNVIMAGSVLLQDHNHAYEDITLPIAKQGVTPGGRIRIEEGCWVGQGAAIICNEGELVIGRNSVVGANSLVTKSVPPYSVVVGNPGRVARQFDPAKEVWIGGGSGRAIAAEPVL
jgi:acetyltransferase-like isoleucine patch superfamily enzyme